MLRDGSSIGPEQGRMGGGVTQLFCCPECCLMQEVPVLLNESLHTKKGPGLSAQALTPEGRERFPVIHYTPVGPRVSCMWVYKA